MSPVRLTILMPCLDEARTLGACIKKAQSYLAHAGISGEIVVADNGSTDHSRDIAHALGVRVVTVAAKGYGNALRAGIEAARGTYVLMGDADDSYDFLELGAFLRRLDDGCDLVIGNRFAGGIKPGAMPLLHRYLAIRCSVFSAAACSGSRSATSTAACAASGATRSCRSG